MAISALPPFNGFVSEWFTYQSLFTLSQSDVFVLKLAGPIAIIMLALTGALAALCFVKVYGISFGGAPRSEKAANARSTKTNGDCHGSVGLMLCVVRCGCICGNPNNCENFDRTCS